MLLVTESMCWTREIAVSSTPSLDFSVAHVAILSVILHVMVSSAHSSSVCSREDAGFL